MPWENALGDVEDPLERASRTGLSRGVPGATAGAQPPARAPRSRWHRRRHDDERAEREAAKRLDIQGLRFIAVATVVLYHAGLKALPGGFVGVDVFFVISGFLITGNIVRHLGTSDFSLGGFYANRARRLLPAAFVTIATTCLVTYFVLPATRFNSIAHDAVSSAFYVINWRLSNQSVDYLTVNNAASPFQHFWSLAVEEQYYLVWPLLLIIAAALVPRSRRQLAFLIAVTVVLVPSLLWSISYTNSDPAQAYFVTTTRMWELAIGGATALTVQYYRTMPAKVAALVAWLGLAAILYSVFVYTTGTPYPGYAAALPTVGAAMVIAGGSGAGRFGPALLLSRRIPVWIGNISYSLYLWHWPIIVFFTAQFSGALPLWAGLLAVAISLVPAALSYYFVEQPGMHAAAFASTRAGLGLGLISSVSAAVAAMLLIAYTPQGPVSNVTVNAGGQAVNVTGQTVKVGAEVLPAHPTASDPALRRNHFSSITPSPDSALHDCPASCGCITSILSSRDITCVFGDADSKTTVDLVGDSHAMQWLPALESAAAQNHWRIVVHAKDACAFNTAVEYRNGPYKACTTWNAEVAKAILADHPAMVITSVVHDQAVVVHGKFKGVGQTRPYLVAGFRAAWTPLMRAGIKIAVLASTPVPNFDVPDCVTEHTDHLTSCAHPASAMVPRHDAMQAAARHTKGVSFVDLNDAICPGSRCPAVIGGVLVYRDDNHLSATYVTTMSARFTKAFTPLLPK